MKQPTHFNFGDSLIHVLTGFSGVVVCKVVYASGTIQYGLQSTKLQESGEPARVQFLEYAHLKRCDTPLKSEHIPLGAQNASTFNMVDQVKSTTVDFTGKITSIAWWIHGCIRYEVTGAKLVEGKLVEVICDEYELELIEGTKIDFKPRGGPEQAPKATGR